MLAGIGKIELTPPIGVELAGYGYYLGRRATHVLDPLYARALYVETEGDHLLLVSCEVLGLERGIAAEVRAALAKKGFAPSQVMLVSIHTHTGPALIYHEGCGNVDPTYQATVAGRILEACALALADARPVTALKAAYAPIEAGYAYNRACEGGSVDEHVRGFVLERGAQAPIAVASYACHAVSRGRVAGVSADYPGALNALLEKDGYRALYINGLCGDIDPWVAPEQDRDERMAKFSGAIHRAFLQSLTPLAMTLQTGSLPFALALQPVTREEICRAAEDEVVRSGSEQAPAARVARIWEFEMLEKFDRLAFTETIEARFFRLGGRLVLALPFEGFTQIGMLLRARLSAPETVVLGCADELLGYLPTRDDIARGAYAALESTFLYKRLPILPGEAERLGESLASALAEPKAVRQQK